MRTIARAQTNVMNDQARSSSRNPRRILLAGAASAFISAAVIGLLWKEQPFLAAVAVAFYIMGGVKFVPWKTPIRKAISIGIFVGIVISIAMFYCDRLVSVAWHPNKVHGNQGVEHVGSARVYLLLNC